MTDREFAKQQALGTSSDQKILDAWEMKDRYLFSLVPSDWPEDQTYMVGTVFTSVDKKTMQVSAYDIMNDPAAFIEAEHFA